MVLLMVSLELGFVPAICGMDNAGSDTAAGGWLCAYHSIPAHSSSSPA
jgi:hypothetical protein